jgi:hypothetical protein
MLPRASAVAVTAASLGAPLFAVALFAGVFVEDVLLDEDVAVVDEAAVVLAAAATFCTSLGNGGVCVDVCV